MSTLLILRSLSSITGTIEQSNVISLRRKRADLHHSPIATQVAAWLAVLCLFLVPSLRAQQPAQSAASFSWKVIKTFDKPIGCGYFWDPDHGLIGSGVRPQSSPRNVIVPGPPLSIYGTDDGGITWWTAITPAYYGAVTRIVMRDRMNGYASIFTDDWRISPGVWTTADGGHTWRDDQIIIPDAGFTTSVDVTSHAIVTTSWNDRQYRKTSNLGMNVSTNGGLTWSQPFVGRGNCVSFVNDTLGVMSAQDVSPYYMRSTDGGATWASTVTQPEAWTVYPVPNTETFITANESQFPYGTEIRATTDGGQTWQVRSRFPFFAMTGGLAGVAGTLYLQTDYYFADTLFKQGAISGVYRSDDTGKSWKWVGGPPHDRDTRLVVTGCSGEVAYVFDIDGNVYKTTDGGNGDLKDGNPLNANFTLDRDSIFIKSSQCSDTVYFSLTNTECVPLYFDSVSKVSGRDFTVFGKAGTQRLIDGESAQTGIVFSPLDSGAQSGVFIVYAHNGNRKITRVVKVEGLNDLPVGISLSSDSLVLSTVNCESRVDSIMLGSISCSDIIFDSLDVLEGELTLQSTFPILSANGVRQSLRFQYDSDTNETHEYKLRLHAHNGVRTFDTVITVRTASVNAAPQLLIGRDSLLFSTKYCESQSLWAKLWQLGCRDLTIDSIVSTSGSFRPDSITSQTLRAGLSESVRIRFDPDSIGDHTGAIHVYGHNATGPCDTVIFLKGFNYAQPNVTLTLGTLVLPTISCQKIDSQFVLVNECCEKITVDSVVGLSGELSVAYDQSLGARSSGDSLRITVSFTPDSGGAVRTGLVRIYAHSASRRFDTVLQVSAQNVIPAVPLTLSTNTLDFVTRYCQPVELPLDLSNFSCTPLAIETLYVFNDALGEFSVSNAPTGAVPVNSSGQFTLRFAPTKRGARSASLRLIGHSLEAKIDTVIALNGKNITSPEPIIGELPRGAAGDTILIPIKLLPTEDAFSFTSFSFHLHSNTDLLTPYRVETLGTYSWEAPNIVFDTVGLDGAFVKIDLKYPVTQDSDLTKPLAYLRGRVTLTNDSTCPLELFTFGINEVSSLPLCEPPVRSFTMGQACGDPTVLGYMMSAKRLASIVSVSPNPSLTGKWKLEYDLEQAVGTASIDVVDQEGRVLEKHQLRNVQKGKHTETFATTLASGSYFVVLSADDSRHAARLTISR